MKKILLLSVSLFLCAWSSASAANFVYPFDKIAAPSCRYSAWSTLSDDCKIELPRIKGADYESYKTNTTYRRIYTVLWRATYDYGWDVWFGSHLGIDIATSAWTPVRSIGEGEIVLAGWQNGWGNVIVVKHTLSDGKNIYSNYAHLSKILVNRGIVQAGTVIGEVGSTGNSTGNHLHFQIDTTNQAHPYYYVTCGKGMDSFSIVNKGLCTDSITSNTIDPIAFLENNTVTTTSPVTTDTIKQIQSKDPIIIERSTIKSRDEILSEEMDEFLKKNSINIEINIPWDNMELGKVYYGKVTAKDYRGQPYRGNLPELGIEAWFDRGAMQIFPDKIIALDKGERGFTVTPLKAGSYTIKFSLGKKTVYTRDVYIIRKGGAVNPEQANIITPKSIILWDEKMSAIIFKTPNRTNQIDIPYYGKYVVKSLKGKVKFCNVSQKKPKKCSSTELVEELAFTYDETFRWVLLFNVIPLDYMPIQLALIKEGGKKDISKTTFDVTVKNPRNLDKTYVYFDDSIAAVKKGFFRTKEGYLLQDRELIGSQAKEMIQGYLWYQFLKAWDNLQTKSIVLSQIKSFKDNTKNLWDFTKITRWEFTKLLLDSNNQPLSINKEKVLIDEAGHYKDYITTLRLRNFQWKDQFWDRYFQPDKTITVGEALYLLNSVSNTYSLAKK